MPQCARNTVAFSALCGITQNCRAWPGPQPLHGVTVTNDSAVLALIPAWNEAPRIGPVLQGVLAHLPVLVVDDGSTDETASVAEAAGAKVVRHAYNQGKGAALKTGFAWALERGYGAVLTLDADGQHDPADIPKFLEAHARGAGELIIGRRNFRVMPFPRPVTTPLGTWLLSRALGQPIYDNQSGYRLYTRRLLEAVHPTRPALSWRSR